MRLMVGVLTLLAMKMCQVSAFVSYLTETGQPQKWNLTDLPTAVSTNVVNPATRAVRYFIGAAAYSTTNRTAELNAVRACFGQWQAVPNSILQFEEGGLLEGKVDVNTSDGTNVIFWAKTPIINGGLDSILGYNALTYPHYLADGNLVEMDIVLNGVSNSWFSDFNDTENPGLFIESVLLHEIGHFIGLSHSPLGAATMFTRGGTGVGVRAGLSSDEVAAVHALYPSTAHPPLVAALTGQVMLVGKPVLGAMVFAQDAAGNAVAGTLTRTNGFYALPGLPPGSYAVRATPMEPINASYYLFRGADADKTFVSAETNFLPSTNTVAILEAGMTVRFNFEVAPGPPAFRILSVWAPTKDSFAKTRQNYAEALLPAADDWVVGVYSTDLPSLSAVLRITGDGLSFGDTTVELNGFAGARPPLNLIWVPVHVAANATPGMRSLVVQQGSQFSFANGFLEIPTPVPDYNFDGLDDRFQREYFPVWTAGDAAPESDPDQDGFTNAAEAMAGSNPIDAQSFLQVDSVRLDAFGATISWSSAPGKRYQVWGRQRFGAAGAWQPLGRPVLALSDHAQYTDSTAGQAFRFFRVQAVSETNGL